MHVRLWQPGQISIHALLAESDCNNRCRNSAGKYFYPRSPCGERHFPAGLFPLVKSISIHALLAESDSSLHLPLLFGL